MERRGEGKRKLNWEELQPSRGISFRRNSHSGRMTDENSDRSESEVEKDQGNRRRASSDGIELVVDGYHENPNSHSDEEDEKENMIEKDLRVVENRKEEIGKEHLNSDRATAAHMFISFVGAGVLGLPYAFMKVGLLGAILVLPFIGGFATYAMILLVECKLELQKSGKMVRGYGDIGFGVFGSKGSAVVDMLLVITQVSFCCAYLLFIGENMHTVIPALTSREVVGLCIPGLSMLVLFRQIKKLSPFALVADVANLVGILVVMSYDVEIFREHELHMDHPLEKLSYGVVFSQLPYFLGVSIYCYEGVGVILPIQESMENKDSFYSVLVFTMMIVTLVYAFFGILGYVAYGVQTKEIITLNLGSGIPTKIVKVALSLGLFFTYPLMMFPVYTIAESSQRLTNSPFWVKNVARIGVVLFSVVVAIGIPNFGDFISLVGAGACSTLALVLPAFFHLRICKSISRVAKVMDWILIIGGTLLAITGTIISGTEILRKLLG